MPRVVHKGDNEDFKSWLCESVLALCRGGLAYRDEFSVEGVIGITVDHSDVFLVRIHDQDVAIVTTKSEKAVQVCLGDRLQCDTAPGNVSSLFMLKCLVSN